MVVIWRFRPTQNQLSYLRPVVLTDEEQTWVQPLRSMALWNRMNLLTAQYAEQHMPDRYLRLRFEDLCGHPVATIEKILDFFDLEADEADINRLAEAEVSAPESLGRWKTQDPATLRALHDVGEVGLRKFGYLASEALPLARPASRFDRDPEEDAVYRQQGDAAFDKGDFERATDYYQKAIKLKPQECIEVHQQLGWALTQQGQLTSAKAAYERALRLQPDDPHTYFLLGSVQCQQGDPSAAILRDRA